MRSLVAILLAVVAAANGSSSSEGSFVSEYYASPYTFVVYDNDGQYVTSRKSTCPPPPSSIEVCLSSLFSTLESQLNTIKTSLHNHQSSLDVNMHHEHTLLTSQISWVSAVTKIANSVSSVVHSDYTNIDAQVYALQQELVQIKELYYYQYAHLESLYEYQQQVIKEQKEIYQQHQYVINAKWSLQGYISAIVQQKEVIESAIAEIQFVVSQLDEQIYQIYNKVEQLNKRQEWLGNWQKKLYVDLENFQKDVKTFRGVQVDLVKREGELYKDQDRLKQIALNAHLAVNKMDADLGSIYSYIKSLEVIEQEITAIYFSVDVDVAQFISAYEVFTCEDSELYYEACASASAAPAPAPAAAPAAKAAAPAAAAAKAAPAAAAAKAAPAAAAAKAAPAAAPAKAAPAAAKAQAVNDKKDVKKPAKKVVV